MKAIFSSDKLEFLESRVQGDTAMNQVVTLPTAAFAQVEQFQQQLLERLMEAGLSTEAIEVILKQRGDLIVDEMATLFCNRIEATKSVCYREILVNYSSTPRQLLQAFDRQQYVNSKILNLLPVSTIFRGIKKIKVGVFKPSKSVYRDGVISNVLLQKEYALHGLKPDLWAAVFLNSTYPHFADLCPNGAACRGEDEHWYYVAFGTWPKNKKRYVVIDQQEGGWADRWYQVGRVLE